MKCSFCSNKAIYKRGDIYYCREHFIKYFEEKALNTIKKYKLIKKGEKIGVAVSGGKDSLSLLYFLNKYKEDLGIDVIGIHIDEGISNYRDITTEFLLNVAKKYNFNIKIYRFSEIFGDRLENFLKRKNIKPCTLCGTWRRWIMWKAAKELNLDKIATAHNLNDEVQTIIMNMLEGNIKDFVKSGPYVGIVESDFVPRIKPFYFNTEKENLIYAVLHGLDPPFAECPFIVGQIRDRVRSILYKLESEFPFHEKFLENVLEIIFRAKEYYKEHFIINLKPCKICGYPTTREICRACELKLEISNQ